VIHEESRWIGQNSWDAKTDEERKERTMFPSGPH
jgi:hypothetical protein